MQKYNFDHVHLTSRDPLKTAEFYEKMFGAARNGFRHNADGRTLVSLNLNGTSIEIIQPRAQRLVPNALADGYGLEHFGLKTDNMDRSVDELKASGVKFLEGVTTRPWGKFSFFLAPEDVLIELVEERGPRW